MYKDEIRTLLEQHQTGFEEENLYRKYALDFLCAHDDFWRRSNLAGRATFRLLLHTMKKIKTRFQAIRQDIDPKNLVAYDEVESFLLPDELEL